MDHLKHKEKVERQTDKWLFTTILIIFIFFFLVTAYRIPKKFFTKYQYTESNDLVTANVISENPYLNGEIEQSGRININIATVETLKQLIGIGDVKAQAIVDYRNKNGRFKNINEILKVKGIGKKTFDNIKEYITV
ncbi:MAG: helix-hairpin-helix domain-containing protein [Clostridia bacterium]|nr:helix-hairpin-helix domain-containing protein [Clostridia bacterium]